MNTTTSTLLADRHRNTTPNGLPCKKMTTNKPEGRKKENLSKHRSLSYVYTQARVFVSIQTTKQNQKQKKQQRNKGRRTRTRRRTKKNEVVRMTGRRKLSNEKKRDNDDADEEEEEEEVRGGRKEDEDDEEAHQILYDIWAITSGWLVQVWHETPHGCFVCVRSFVRSTDSMVVSIAARRCGWKQTRGSHHDE